MIAKEINISSEKEKYNGKGYLVSFGEDYLKSEMVTFCHYQKTKKKKEK